MASQENWLHYLSWEEAEAIEDKYERLFALRCLAVGCLVVHQVPVGQSVIDFFVANPKRNEPEGGILVEITHLSKEDMEKRTRVIHRKNGTKTVNKTGERKKRQLQALENSGFKHVMLHGNNMRSILNTMGVRS